MGLGVAFQERSGRRIVAVEGLSLTLPQGGRLALLGESGSGKTATALAIAGLLPAGAEITGAIAWPALGLPPGRAPRLGRDVGIVFQDPMSSLNPVLSVGEQVGEVLVTHKGVGWRAAAAGTAALLQRVGLDPALAPAFPHQLSGGQRQRVAIAIAVAAGPRLLIADEPTTALDTVVQAGIVRLLKQLVQAQGGGMALLVITHDLALAAQLAADAVVLRAGRAVAAGPLARLLAAAAHPCPRVLVQAAGSFSTPGPAPAPASAGEPLLEVAGLRRTFRERTRTTPAVDGVALTIRRGETVALVGGSGAGKTTVARLILRLIEPDAGSIRFAGHELTAMQGAALRRLRPRLQAVFQDPLGALNPRATVGRLLADPLRVHRLVPRAQRPAAVAGLLHRVGLASELAARHPHQLSGGQRQRVTIARALATAPELLLLDEPVASLDPLARAGILDLLRRLKAETGMACLLVSHDLAVVRAVADRVLVMERGRIVEAGPVAAVLESPRSEAAQALVAAMPRLSGGG